MFKALSPIHANAPTRRPVARPWRFGFAVALGLCLPLAVSAGAVYRLEHPQDSVVGALFYVPADARLTLLDIGRHHGTGFDQMQAANPQVDMWVPAQNADVLIPAKHVLPNAPREGLVLNLAEKRLFFYRSANEVEVFSVGTAREGWSTPTGRFTVIEKRANPTWTPPASIRADYARRGITLPAVVPPGPENPLGNFALRLSNPSYLIHGTNKPWGVGMPVSAGCTRMYPEDIERLFPQVPVGTPVTIVDQPYKFGWLGDRLYLEVHANDENRQATPQSIVPAALANAEGVTIDWEEVRRVKQENAGLPRLVGSRRQSASWHHFDMIF